MKTELKTARQHIAEGTMEEIEKAFDILFSLVEGKPAYQNQLTIIRSDYGQWKDRKIKQLDPPDAEKNSVIDRMLAIITSLEKGEKTPTISTPVKFMQGIKDAGSFVVDELGDFLTDSKTASFITVVLLWFVGGYLLGMFLAKHENNKVPDDEFYRDYVYWYLRDEVSQEQSNPDGKIYFTCGDDFAFQCNLPDGSWAEVPGERYGAPPSSGSFAVAMPLTVATGAIPVGLGLFKDRILATIGGGSGNWRYVVYGLMFASGTGYGYYSHRRKYPTCADNEVKERLRDPAFAQRITALIVNRLSQPAPVPGVVLPKKGYIISDSTLIIRGLKGGQ